MTRPRERCLSRLPVPVVSSVWSWKSFYFKGTPMCHRHRKRRGASPAGSQEESAPEVATHGELGHFLRLARVGGVEDVMNAYTRAEILEIVRANNIAGINSRGKKVDLVRTLIEMR